MTLPEELAEEIRAAVGSGGFSRYVAQAIERQREHDHLADVSPLLQRVTVGNGLACPATDDYRRLQIHSDAVDGCHWGASDGCRRTPCLAG
ncbi:hypothetical protein GCM10009738_47090 [Kitasatospora viridis]